MTPTPPAPRRGIPAIVPILGILFVGCCGLLTFGGAKLWGAGGMGDSFQCTLLGQEGKYEEAIPHCRAAVKARSDALNNNQLGWTLALAGKGEEAIAPCEEAVKQNDTPEFNDSLAMALARAGHGKRAMEIEQTKVLVNGDVTDDPQRVTLGMVYYSVGRKEDAYKQWDKARHGDNAVAIRLAVQFKEQYK